MEKTQKGIVLTMDVFWSDVGNWKSVWETAEKDKDGNLYRRAIGSEEREIIKEKE